MLLPFFVGQYSVTSILLDVFIPAFSSQSDWGAADENGFQFNGSFLQTVIVFFQNLHLGEKRSCLYGIPCISLILVIFAITAWRFVRQRRTSERTVDRHVNRVCCIAGGWLTHPSYRWMSRCLCALTVLHWFTREWLFVHFLSSMTADLTNAVATLPISKVPRKFFFFCFLLGSVRTDMSL